MVVQTAGQDARPVGDVTDGGGAQTAVGEHGRGELQQLVSPAVRLTGHSVHLASVSTKRLLGQLQRYLSYLRCDAQHIRVSVYSTSHRGKGDAMAGLDRPQRPLATQRSVGAASPHRILMAALVVTIFISAVVGIVVAASMGQTTAALIIALVVGGGFAAALA